MQLNESVPKNRLIAGIVQIIIGIVIVTNISGINILKCVCECGFNEIKGVKNLPIKCQTT